LPYFLLVKVQGPPQPGCYYDFYILRPEDQRTRRLEDKWSKRLEDKRSRRTGGPAGQEEGDQETRMTPKKENATKKTLPPILNNHPMRIQDYNTSASTT